MNEWYKLKMAGIREAVIIKLMNCYESYNDIWRASFKEINEMCSGDSLEAKKVLEAFKINLEESIEKYRKESVKIISLKDIEYPHLLKNIDSPPPFLYTKGNKKPSDKSIGVVGTRKMTKEGRGACEYLVKGLAKVGVDIISGLALGVDSCAHNVAIRYGSTPIAVVGNGLDIVYPSANRKLYAEVEENGLIISELPLGTEPARWTFPRRNRIIAGLSRGVLVVESYDRGGSLITAMQALEEGRDVYAVPGMINYPSFEGCNSLIKRGEAKLVSKVEDILDEYSWSSEKEKIKNIGFENIVEEIIYNELITPKNLDELILSTRRKAPELLAILGEMELNGFIRSMSGGKFGRCE
jgi:DNA processing protein